MIYVPTFLIFFKSNIKKFVSIILSLIVFLLIFNLISGLVKSLYDNFKTGIVDNEALYFMEVYSDTDMSLINMDLNKKIKNIKGVEYTICDFAHPVYFSKNKEISDFGTILGVPKGCLKYFGVKDDVSDQNFIILNTEDKNQFKIGENVSIEEQRYCKGNNKGKTEFYNVTRKVCGFSNNSAGGLFPDDTILIDDKTAEEIARGQTEDGVPQFGRIIVIVPNVDDMSDISKQIEGFNSGITTRYALKSTKQIPQFAVVIVAVSAVLFLVLLLFSVISISSSLKQILILRKRDITLFNIFGIEDSAVNKIFMSEFICYGLIAFVGSVSLSFIIFYLLSVLFRFDILTNNIPLYLVLDLLLSLGIIMISGYVQLKMLVKKLSSKYAFKESLN